MLQGDSGRAIRSNRRQRSWALLYGRRPAQCRSPNRPARQGLRPKLQRRVGRM